MELNVREERFMPPLLAREQRMGEQRRCSRCDQRVEKILHALGKNVYLGFNATSILKIGCHNQHSSR